MELRKRGFIKGYNAEKLKIVLDKIVGLWLDAITSSDTLDKELIMYYRDEFIEPIDYDVVQSKEDACIDFLRDLAESITAHEREYAADWAMDELGMSAHDAQRAVDDAFAALIKWSEESDELPCGRYDAMVWMGACMIDEETMWRYNETQRGW